MFGLAATAVVAAVVAEAVVATAVVTAAAEDDKNQDDAATAIVTEEIHLFPSFRLHYILLRKDFFVTLFCNEISPLLRVINENTQRSGRMGKKLSPKREEVNLQFKLLSAIAIVLVVAGHCHKGGISLGYDWFPIYSFQIGLLVFISGYFYKPNHETRVMRYLWKRFQRLVIPAYLWNIAYGGLLQLLHACGYTFGVKVNAFNLFVMPFIDGEGFCLNLGAWFVYPLFAACAVNVLFRKMLGLLKLDKEYLVAVVYLAVGICGVSLAIGMKSTGGVKGLDRLLLRSMFFLPFYGLGRLYHSKLEKYDKLNSYIYFGILFAAQLILLTVFEKLEFTPSKMSGFDNGSAMPFVSSVLGIAFWLRATRITAPLIQNWRVIRMVADNSYSIMLHHFWGFFYVKWVFYAISEETDWFADFDAAKLHSEFWYYYLPNERTQWGMVYALVGIVFSVLMGVTGKIIWQYLLGKFGMRNA